MMPHSPWTAVCTVSGCDQIAIVVVRHSFSRPIPSVGILYLQIPAGIYMCTLEPRLISDGRLPFPYSIREGLPVTQVEPGLGAAGAPSRVFAGWSTYRFYTGHFRSARIGESASQSVESSVPKLATKSIERTPIIPPNRPPNSDPASVALSRRNSAQAFTRPSNRSGAI